MATTIYVKRGDNFLATFLITDAGGEANLAGAVVNMQLRDARSRVLYLSLSTEDVDSALSLDDTDCEGATPCKVLVNVPYTAMEAVPVGKYKTDLEFLFAGSKKRSTETLIVVVEQDYTYAETP